MPKGVLMKYQILGSGLDTLTSTDVNLVVDQTTGTKVASSDYSNDVTPTQFNTENMFLFSNYESNPGTEYHKFGVQVKGKMYDIEVDASYTPKTTTTDGGDTVSVESVDGVLQWKIIPAARKRTTRKKKAE